MASRYYKQWSPKEREQGYANTKLAIKKGIVHEARRCNRCTQNQGILQLHCEDYDFTIKILPQIIIGNIELTEEVRAQIDKALEPLCWRCHMIHHSQHINPEACARYWKAVKAGTVFHPVYKHDFGILARENGIHKMKTREDGKDSKPKDSKPVVQAKPKIKSPIELNHKLF